MRKKLKKQKLLNYKKAIRHAKAVVNASKRGEIPHSIGAEQFLREIEPHLTKKGTLKKRDIRSNIQIANINKIISKYVNKNDINKSVKKLIKEFNFRSKNLENKRVAEVGKGENMIKTFTNLSNFELQGIFYLSSEQIVELSNEYGEITIEDMQFITYNLLKNKYNNIPNELLELVKEDDFYKLCDKMLYLMKNNLFDKDDISIVINNANNSNYNFSEEQENILAYIGDNFLFKLIGD